MVSVTLTMDPRIRQRRIAVRRDEGRRRLRILMAFVAVVVAVAGCIAAARSPLLAVHRIEVSGANRTGDAKVLSTSRLDRPGHLMVDVHPGVISRRLETLPWVARASVKRVWPQTIRIAIRERAPVAALSSGSAWAVLDQDGRVLDVSPSVPKGVLTLVDVPPAGPPGSHVDPLARPALAVAAGLPGDVTSRLVAVGVSGAGDLQLHLKGGGVALLGPADDVAAKVLALRTLLARVDLRSVAIIDVRVPGAPVLTRQGAAR
jgi:cell division protein FtsQ